MNHFFKKYPLFLFLLPAFFVFHGFTENYNLIPAKDSFFLALKYTCFSLLLALLFKLLVKSFSKASLVVFFIMAYNFFFGNAYDFIKDIFGNSILTKYSVILPVTFIILIAFIIYIKKTKKNFSIFFLYLNWLFLILIAIDSGNFLLKFEKENKSETITFSKEFTDCITCSKPDIYLILTDEYAGQTELQDIFHFDNSSFLNELQKRNYRILSASYGNYNFTHYSMAAMLDMKYIPNITGDHSSKHDRSITFGMLKKNKTLQYLIKQGYSFYNYSVFDFNGQPSLLTPTFIAGKTVPITSQTFISRLRRDLGYHLITTLKLKWFMTELYYDDLRNNDKVYKLTKEIAAKKTTTPKFVYTHLAMPHYRYYFDSKGIAAPFEKIIDDSYCWDKKAYIEYLQYTNGKLLALIDHIKKTSEKPPVILLMSDHGYRQFLSQEDIKNVAKKYYFLNLNAVYFPNGDYSKFYDSLSNVNQFRVVLNTLFAQKLPLLKDSTIFLPQ